MSHVMRTRLAALALFPILGLPACDSGRPSSLPQAPGIEFSDLQGSRHSLANVDRPALVGFWVRNCSYCTNMFGVLNAVAAKHSSSDLAMYAFCTTPVSEEDIAGAAAQEGFSGMVVNTHQREELIRTMATTFNLMGAGRRVYVVDVNGRYQTVPLVNGSDQFLPQADVVGKLEAAIEAARQSAAVPAAVAEPGSLIH